MLPFVAIVGDHVQRGERRLSRRVWLARSADVSAAVRRRAESTAAAREAVADFVELLRRGVFAAVCVTSGSDGRTRPQQRSRRSRQQQYQHEDAERRSQIQRAFLCLIADPDLSFISVSSVPAPDSAARRNTRSAATTSSTAMPSDLKTVISSVGRAARDAAEHHLAELAANVRRVEQSRRRCSSRRRRTRRGRRRVESTNRRLRATSAGGISRWLAGRRRRTPRARPATPTHRRSPASATTVTSTIRSAPRTAASAVSAATIGTGTAALMSSTKCSRLRALGDQTRTSFSWRTC